MPEDKKKQGRPRKPADNGNAEAQKTSFEETILKETAEIKKKIDDCTKKAEEAASKAEQTRRNIWDSAEISSYYVWDTMLGSRTATILFIFPVFLMAFLLFTPVLADLIPIAIGISLSFVMTGLLGIVYCRSLNPEKWKFGKNEEILKDYDVTERYHALVKLTKVLFLIAALIAVGYLIFTLLSCSEACTCAECAASAGGL